MSTVTEEHPSFFEEEFRSDVERLEKAEDTVVAAVKQLLASDVRHRDLMSAETWVPVARQTGLSLEDLMAIYRPLRFISAVAHEEHVGVRAVVTDLVKANVVPSALEHTILDLTEPLTSIMADALSSAPQRTLPGLRIRRISTTCNVIAQFENEFSLKTDDPGTYEPRFSGLYTYTVLRLAFHNDEQQPVLIALTEENLNDVIKWLELARKQHLTAKGAVQLRTGEAAEQ